MKFLVFDDGSGAVVAWRFFPWRYWRTPLHAKH